MNFHKLNAHGKQVYPMSSTPGPSVSQSRGCLPVRPKPLNSLWAGPVYFTCVLRVHTAGILGKERRNSRGKEGGGKKGNTGAYSCGRGSHLLQLLSFSLHGRANCFDFHRVLLHHVFQALHQLLFEVFLLLFSLMFDFTKVFFISLLHIFCLNTCLSLGLLKEMGLWAII